ncbi:MAG: thioredoxin family protein [Bifidobacterium sp.]|nr:thioredoxin family protein [Bifidobacterium sp.]
MADNMFPEDVREQLDEVFSRLERKVALELDLDRTDTSAELKEFISQLVDLSHGKLTMTTKEVGALDADGRGVIDLGDALPACTPIVRILADDGSGNVAPTGIAFHGIPGQREFSSFVMGIYDAGSRGQEVAAQGAERAKAVAAPVDVMLIVSLECPYCEATVKAADRVATLSPNVRAEAYDVQLYAQLADKYNVQGVPVVVVTPADGGEPSVTVGEQSVSGLLDLIEAAAE